MENNNIFKYATKELSQDAFICWCINWINYPESELYNLGSDMLNFILVPYKNCENLYPIKNLKIVRQFKKMDIVITINKEYVVIIEDKIDAVIGEKTNNEISINEKMLDIKKKLKAKRKTINIPTNLCIYAFNTFDEYLEFCTFLPKHEKNTYTFLKKSSLYLYKSKYYLCLHINEKDANSFKSIHYSIIEFGSHINNSELFESKLKEYGKVIFKTNAINNCIKHFGNI